MPAALSQRILLETASLSAPGKDRGLGRYTSLWKEAYETLGVEVQSLDEPVGLSPRLRPLRDASGSTDSTLHATAPSYLPLRKDRRWICSIQDTIPLDLASYRRFGIKFRVAYANARRADLVVANSQHTAARCRDLLRIPEGKLVIIPLPLSDTFLPDCVTPLSHRGCYFGSLVDLRTPDPRKRYHWLEALAREANNLGYEMRVAGRGLDNLGSVAPSCVPVETPSDESLRNFLGEARAFVYTSAYEGQGLPPIEAMGLGTPVIAFANTSITEMVGDGGALLPDPVPWQSQSLLTDVPRHALSEFREAAHVLTIDSAWQEMSDKARARAQAFDFKSFTAKIDESLLRSL